MANEVMERQFLARNDLFDFKFSIVVIARSSFSLNSVLNLGVQ
jgi:hypothetical protein